MKKRYFGFTCLLVMIATSLLFWLHLEAAEGEGMPTGMVLTASGQMYTENILVLDLRDFGYAPMSLTPENVIHNASTTMSSQLSTSSPLTSHNSQLEWGGGSNPQDAHPVIHKTAPTFLQPGATAHYEITLTNSESITHTYHLTDTLPPQLTYIPDSATATGSVQAAGLTYNDTTRTLTWQGELAPGRLEMIIEENSLSLPYLDLADFGITNLCAAFIANNEACDDVTVTFNLGVNGYSTHFYGETHTQILLSSDGIALVEEAAETLSASGHNRWLPDASPPGQLLAGLWGDVDLTENGRWHAAIIQGWIEGQDVFYAQWHDAPHAQNPDLTARHAIAIVLDKEDVPETSTTPALAGHAFFLYDNISDPAQTIARGYTIGVEDKLGLRGTTYAYAPCCGDSRAAQGHPPAAGTTLHLRPVLFAADDAYRRTFSYDAIVNAQVPETIINTAVVTSTSPNPAFAHAWSTHYLYVRLQTFLPLLRADEVQP